jgi:hypothetical protein
MARKVWRKDRRVHLGTIPVKTSHAAYLLIIGDLVHVRSINLYPS